MDKDIFNIIKIASDQGRVLSESEITEIFEILRDSQDLYSVCNLIDFVPIERPSFASYFFNIKMIEMDLGKILNHSKLSNIYGINLIILQVLLHEIEHAKQYKIVLFEESLNNSHRDIEKILLDSSYDYLRFSGKTCKVLSDEEKAYLRKLHINIDRHYFKNLVSKHIALYHYAPNERLAELKSYYKINQMIKTNGLDKETEEYFKNKFDSKLIQGYEKKQGYLCFYSPSYNYMSRLKLDGNLNKVKDFEDKYLQDPSFNFFRLLYGVHVDEEYLKEKIRKLRK